MIAFCFNGKCCKVLQNVLAYSRSRLIELDFHQPFTRFQWRASNFPTGFIFQFFHGISLVLIVV